MKKTELNLIEKNIENLKMTKTKLTMTDIEVLINVCSNSLHDKEGAYYPSVVDISVNVLFYFLQQHTNFDEIITTDPSDLTALDILNIYDLIDDKLCISSLCTNFDSVVDKIFKTLSCLSVGKNILSVMYNYNDMDASYNKKLEQINSVKDEIGDLNAIIKDFIDVVGVEGE